MYQFLLSVIIPTRNRQKYAEAAARQILGLKQDIQVNDDISLVDPALVKFYPGDRLNFKVTTDEDLKYLKDYLEN